MNNLKLSKFSKIFLILGFFSILALIYGFITYNSLKDADIAVIKNKADLDASYIRRATLVPDLVAVVKGNSQYEKTTLVDVIEARNLAEKAKSNLNNNASINDIEISQVALIKAANISIANIERYPELTATKSFLMLQEQLEGTERRVSFARKDFNNAVSEYNKLVRNFPAKIIASILGFKEKEGFKAEDATSGSPQISFSK
jgi:LemA protein